MRSSLLAVGLLALCAAPADAKKFRVPKTTRQVVTVVTESWTAQKGKLTRWERNATGPWKKVGEPIEVNVGKKGLGWGYGLHPEEDTIEHTGPLKSEGDARGPAGVFRLSEATGYGPAPPPGTTLPYRQAGDKLRCVDDPKSKLYNQFAEEGAGTWASAEIMHRTDELYTFTITVDHNKKPIVPGQGSCIFLHAGKDPTVGCTAMPLPDLEALLVWLKADAQPIYVALPQKEYEQLGSQWKLPPL